MYAYAGSVAGYGVNCGPNVVHGGGFIGGWGAGVGIIAIAILILIALGVIF
ncbi:MAG: hypothetical protein QMC95_03495 [Desulfitobacteriaceae bacterium]|nr:hypothetical protein [Desulfitobacteriaceae bacterium]MDI6878369.1 hypothetical protein [Desulfitobacteriaceae bacterium]MDI6913265.1 hypothetical protein [Desulfitobacteriaceae bacterium]